MEVWCTCGECSQCGRLELPEIVPESGDVAAARIGQLANFTGGPVAERVQRKFCRTNCFRRSADVKQHVTEAGAVVCRVMTAVAASTVRVHAVEYHLSARNLSASRV